MPTGKEKGIEHFTMTFEGEPIITRTTEELELEEDEELETSETIALLEGELARLKEQNAYLKGKVEVLEGFATRRLEFKENGEWESLR